MLTSSPTPSLPVDQVRQLSPAALAYLGDAIYEVHVRQQLLFPPCRSEVYHQRVVRRVRGSAQAETLVILLPHLTEQELEIVRWGRNGCGRSPKHLSPQQYQQASGFETLVGYLHLTQPQRLQEILALADRLTDLSE
jgi:ribonuclease-3 family protein